MLRGDQDSHPPKIDANYVENVAEGRQTQPTRMSTCARAVILAQMKILIPSIRAAFINAQHHTEGMLRVVDRLSADASVGGRREPSFAIHVSAHVACELTSQGQNRQFGLIECLSLPQLCLDACPWQ